MPEIGGENFSRDDAHERGGHRHAHSSHDVRNSGRDDDEHENLELTGPQALRCTLAGDRRSPHARGRIDDDDEKSAPENQKVFRKLADPEPDDRDGYHRRGRQIAQQLEDRIEQIVQDAETAEQHTGDDSGKRSGHESDHDSGHADRHVVEDLAAHQHRDCGADDLERRGDQERVEQDCR